MSDHILTNAELCQLTGAQRPKQQVEVLKRNGIRYILDAANHPIVIWDAVRQVVLTSDSTQNKPNFEVLERGSKTARR